MWLEQSKGVREKGKIETSAPPVGFKPTTPCISGKHTTTVLRRKLQVVGDEVDSNPCTGERRKGCYLSRQVLNIAMTLCSRQILDSSRGSG